MQHHLGASGGTTRSTSRRPTSTVSSSDDLNLSTDGLSLPRSATHSNRALPKRPPPAVPSPNAGAPGAAALTAGSSGAVTDAGAGASASVPPPLPPKPAFARGSAMPKPPPLPPKPASARAPRVGEPPARPVRPLPAPPGSSPSPAPPEVPTAAKPLRHRRLPSSSTREDVTITVPTSSSSSFPILAGNGTARRPRSYVFPVPFPPPACCLRAVGMTRLSGRGRADSRDVSLSAVEVVPRTGQADAKLGAATIVVKRRATSASSLPQAPTRGEDGAELFAQGAAPCRWYPGARPGGEMWGVVDRIVESPPELPSRAWGAAMEVLVGIIINATIDNFDDGFLLCTEIVRRVRATPRGANSGIFALLVNIGGQASFAGNHWRSIERMVLSIFSSVVEELDAETTASVDQAGGESLQIGVRSESSCAVLWSRAVKCAMALLGGGSRFGNMSSAVSAGRSGVNKGFRGIGAPPTLKWIGRRPQLSGPAISLRALLALARRISQCEHPVVEQVLVGEGLWRGFRGGFEEDDDVLRSNVDEEQLYGPYGGIDEIIAVYVRCRSLAARRRMCALIMEVAVARVRGRPDVDIADDEAAVEEQIAWIFSLMRASDVGDALVSTFRLGPDPSFVMDTLRDMLFDPLSAVPPSSCSVTGDGRNASVPGPAAVDEDHRRSGNFSRGSTSATSARTSAPDGREVLATNEYRSAIILANRLLHKRFVITVLMEVEAMAKSFSVRLREESGRLGPCSVPQVGERMEMKLVELRRAARSNNLRSVRQIWQGLHAVSIAPLDGRNPSKEEVIVIIQNLLSIILLPLPFANVLSDGADSEAEAFLLGERRLTGRTSCMESADMIVSLLHASTTFVGSRYMSELRQVLVEVLGSTNVHALRAAQFTEDPDPVVAYRARCICPEDALPNRGD